MNRRVVITGLGAVSALGDGAKALWQGLSSGKSGIDYITGFDTTNFKVKVAAEAKGFQPETYLDRKEARRMDRNSQFGVVAAGEALEDAGIKMDQVNAERVGVMVGSGIGGIATIEKEVKTLIQRGADRVSPLFIPMAIGNMATGNIAIKYGAKGICTAAVTACATGANAIGDAFRTIRHGYADVMIAGGTEASITEVSIAGFTNLTALSNSSDPQRASTPFDAGRSGFVMGEGAGVIILEDLEHALARGARIYAEIVGYGATGDAYHITAPDPNGEGAARAMRLAMEDGDVNPTEVACINAHGTSTPINDKLETLAIKKAFGEHAYQLAVSSNKSMIGHLLGAAGAVEGISSVLTLYHQLIPPTLGYETPDPDCDLDYVPLQAREAKVNYVLSNSLGFGGHNATLLFKKYE